MGPVDQLLDQFDFELVHKAMTAVDWKWAHKADDIRVPTIAELRACARDLAERLLACDGQSISTGGFTVRRTSESFDGWERKFIELDFCLTARDVELSISPV